MHTLVGSALQYCTRKCDGVQRLPRTLSPGLLLPLQLYRDGRTTPSEWTYTEVSDRPSGAAAA